MGPNEQIKLAALTAAAALQAAREALDAAVATAAAEVEIKLLMASMSTSKAESILPMDRAAGSLCCVAASCATAPLKEKGARACGVAFEHKGAGAQRGHGSLQAGQQLALPL